MIESIFHLEATRRDPPISSSKESEGHHYRVFLLPVGRCSKWLFLIEDAVGVVGDGGRPVGENADDAHVSGEYVDHDVHVGVLVDRIGHRLFKDHISVTIYCTHLGCVMGSRGKRRYMSPPILS